MAKHTYGEPVSEDDVLVLQGIEYPMQPVGMRAVKKMLVKQKDLVNRNEDDPLTEEELELAYDIVLSAVRPDVRDRLRDHIDESVGPGLLLKVANGVMESFSDVDPTEQESSSTGSSPTGPGSTAGAPLAPPIPTN